MNLKASNSIVKCWAASCRKSSCWGLSLTSFVLISVLRFRHRSGNWRLEI
jgi:hypothetical protein